MNTEPGRKRGQVVGVDEDQRLVGVLQHAVDDDVEAGQHLGHRVGLGVVEVDDVLLAVRVAVEAPHAHRGERRGDRGDRALGEHGDVADAQRRQPA